MAAGFGAVELFYTQLWGCVGTLVPLEMLLKGCLIEVAKAVENLETRFNRRLT